MERASTRRSFAAGRWVERGHGLDALPTALDCPPLVAWHVAICFPPRDEADIEHWARVVSRRFGLDPERVRTVARMLV